MPNWCENTMQVYGATAEVERFMAAARATVTETIQHGARAGETVTKSLPLSFNALYPLPEDVAATLEGQGEPGVTPDWYSWRINHWGVKWDVDESTTVDTVVQGDHLLAEYTFDTAWTPPVEWLAKVAADFPSLSFKLEYQEQGMGFAGINGFAGGECVENIEYEPTPYSHAIEEYSEMIGE